MSSHKKGDHVMNMHGKIILEPDMKSFCVLQTTVTLHEEIYLDVYYYSILGRYANS